MTVEWNQLGLLRNNTVVQSKIIHQIFINVHKHCNCAEGILTKKRKLTIMLETNKSTKRDGKGTTNEISVIINLLTKQNL